MRVLFNTTAALEGTSGFTQTIELLGALTRLPAGAGHEYAVLTTRAQAPLREELGALAEHVVVDAPDNGMARTAWLWATLPSIVKRAGASMLYNRGNFYAPRLPCAQICLLENANPFSPLGLSGHAGMRARNALLRLMSEAALRKATAVVFPTSTAHRAIVSGRTVRARPFVIPHGAEMPPPGPDGRPVPGPYILSVTSLFPFKNLSIALRAFDMLRNTGRFTGHLVIVGDHGPSRYVRALHDEIAARGLQGTVRILPPVPRQELSAWYRDAAVALTTSLEETFGLPVVEAMGLGAPVVAPDVAGPAHRYFLPFRELCGDAAEYFDPFDAASCAAAVARALAEPRRTAMQAAGRLRAREYTWQAAAMRTAAMLTELDASRSCSGSARRDTTGTSP
jgi:glycosyltransferase involved in cell wall biosynthesis